MMKHYRQQNIHFFIALICLSVLSIISSVAKAEGNCPPGYYPVGGQGVQGCAPIPNYGGGGGYAQPSYRSPTTEGYVAAGTNGVIGVATAKIFRGKLEEKALQDCEKKGVQVVKFGLLMMIIIVRQSDRLKEPIDFIEHVQQLVK